MHEVLVNRLGGLSLPRKSVVRLTDRPDMTLDVYRGRKKKQYNIKRLYSGFYPGFYKLMIKAFPVIGNRVLDLHEYCRCFSEA